jgi:hypothetical protein
MNLPAQRNIGHGDRIGHLQLSGIENEISVDGHWNDPGLIGHFAPIHAVSLHHNERRPAPEPVIRRPIAKIEKRGCAILGRIEASGIQVAHLAFSDDLLTRKTVSAVHLGRVACS